MWLPWNDSLSSQNRKEVLIEEMYISCGKGAAENRINTSKRYCRGHNTSSADDISPQDEEQKVFSSFFLTDICVVDVFDITQRGFQGIKAV